MNSNLKKLFHNNTQTGGGKGGSSKLLPIMYKLARGMLWRYGHLDALFHHLGYQKQIDIEYQKIKPMPCMKDVSIREIEHFSRMVMDLFVDEDALEETETELTTIPEDAESEPYKEDGYNEMETEDII